MLKHLLTFVGIVNGVLFVAVLIESIFAFQGPIFQFVEGTFRGGRIPYPGQFYIAALGGFALFAMFGFLNRNRLQIPVSRLWKYWAVVISLFGIVVFVINRVTDIPFLQNLYEEDNLFENLTFVFLFVASSCASTTSSFEPNSAPWRSTGR